MSAVCFRARNPDRSVGSHRAPASGRVVPMLRGRTRARSSATSRPSPTTWPRCWMPDDDDTLAQHARARWPVDATHHRPSTLHRPALRTPPLTRRGSRRTSWQRAVPPVVRGRGRRSRPIVRTVPAAGCTPWQHGTSGRRCRAGFLRNSVGASLPRVSSELRPSASVPCVRRVEVGNNEERGG